MTTPTARVVIGEEDGSEFVIEENGRFNINIVNVPSGSRVDSQEVSVEIEGDIVKGTPELVWTDMKTTSEVAYENLDSRPVRIYLGAEATARFIFLPEEFIIGPFVTAFSTIAEPGAGRSHWRYAMTITGIKAGVGGGTEANVINLTGSITTMKVNGLAVRKEWRVSVKSTTASAAFGIVMGYKPSETRVVESTDKFPAEQRATGTWIWEQRFSSNIISYEETIESVGGGLGVDYIEDLQLGPDTVPPVLHKAMRTAEKITLRGMVKGFSNSLSAPPAHWSESDLMVRVRSREVRSFPLILDHTQGIYGLSYMECWIWTGASSPPAPNHDVHGTISSVSPPSDGRIMTINNG